MIYSKDIQACTSTSSFNKGSSYLRQYVPIGDQVALAVDHVRDHHDLVGGGVGELQRQLRGLDVEGEHDRLGPLDDVGPGGHGGRLVTAPAPDRVPRAAEHLQVDGDAHVVRHVVLAERETKKVRLCQVIGYCSSPKSRLM